MLPENKGDPTSSSPSASFRISRIDVVVMGVIMLISLGLLLGWQFRPVAASGTVIRIVHDNALVKELNPYQNTQLELGGMLIEVKHGAVRVVRSDCPRGICRRAGWISKPGSTIVCVPNRVLIEILGKRDGKAYDAVTY